jgi:hypothetical protein
MAQESSNFLGYQPHHGASEEVGHNWEPDSAFRQLGESGYDHFPLTDVPGGDASTFPQSAGGESHYGHDDYFPISPRTSGANPGGRGRGGGSHSIATSGGSPTSSSTFNILNPADGSLGEAEEVFGAAIEEDKRRRNTAASARFRLKKKEREADLEKRARDMTDRCEALQKRIGALETENRWLRELITERGRNRGRGGRGGRERERERGGKGKGKDGGS